MSRYSSSTYEEELESILREYGSGSGYWDAPGQRTARAARQAGSGESRAAYAPAPAPARKKRRRRPFRKLMIAVLMLALCYCVAVYSHIPFIAKWRTIYIETAMTTFTHQWLATKFIPAGVIDKVMQNASEKAAQQSGLSSGWGSGFSFGKGGKEQPWEKEQKKFFQEYPEIDQESFKAFMAAHPDEFVDEEGFLVIDKAGLDDEGTTITTVHGDQVLAIDTKNGIIIIKVTGEGYVGRLAIVKDPSRVGLALSPNFDDCGATVGEIARASNAVLAINASGFMDPNGQGNGGNAYGLVISNGQLLKNPEGGSYKTIAFDYENRLHIGSYSDYSNFRDAVEFQPALIIDGEILVSDSDGWGLQPRSAIGQTKEGEVLLLIVDGRAPGYSLGCTVGELAAIMDRYGAYQACNLDGGSSSVLYYNGREINKPSAANKVNGRYVPNGFVVYGK